MIISIGVAGISLMEMPKPNNMKYPLLLAKGVTGVNPYGNAYVLQYEFMLITLIGVVYTCLM